MLETLTQEHVFGAVFAIITLLVTLLIIHLSKDKKSKVNFEDLLLDERSGKMSKEASVLFGSFIVTSIVLVYQAFKGNLSDMNFGAYLAAWVAPLVAAMFRKKDDGGPPQP